MRIIFLVLLFKSQLAIASEGWSEVSGRRTEPVATSNLIPDTLLGPAPPFTPRRTDYAIELGLMRSLQDNFWLGANLGYHVGRCIFSESQTCQQYFDIIGGAGVREAESYGMLLGSLRWQYVNFPDRASPFWRIYAGPSFVNRAEQRGWFADSGVGVGVTTFLHDKVDLRLEARLGYVDSVYGQALVGVQIKADRLLSYFAEKLKDFGYGTVSAAVDAAGAAIQATGEGVGGIVKGVGKQIKGDEPSSKSDPQSTEAK